MLVAREFHFEAAHQLPNHPGKCRNLHGHRYRMRVVCRAPVDAETGLAIDFAHLKQTVNARVVDRLDHAYLNEILPIPSAENIAIWAWDELLATDLPLYEIEVQETQNSSVIYRGEGRDG